MKSGNLIYIVIAIVHLICTIISTAVIMLNGILSIYDGTNFHDTIKSFKKKTCVYVVN